MAASKSKEAAQQKVGEIVEGLAVHPVTVEEISDNTGFSFKVRAGYYKTYEEAKAAETIHDASGLQCFVVSEILSYDEAKAKGMIVEDASLPVTDPAVRLQALKELEEADEHYDQAELDSHAAFFARGVDKRKADALRHQAKEHFRRAKFLCEKVITQNPKSPSSAEARMALAYCYISLGHPREAVDAQTETASEENIDAIRRNFYGKSTRRSIESSKRSLQRDKYWSAVSSPKGQASKEREREFIRSQEDFVDYMDAMEVASEAQRIQSRLAELGVELNPPE